MSDPNRKPRLLAIASGGGHWEQLMLVRDAFAGAELTYATTMVGLAERSGLAAKIVPDCNRNEKVKALRCAVEVLLLVLRVRPDVIITTGALPGYFAVLIGKRLGARTLWLDSVANAEEPSMAGRLAQKHVDRWLSQWPEVAAANHGEYFGAVL